MSFVKSEKEDVVHMSELMFQELLNRGNKLAMVPVSRLQDIKEDIEELKKNNTLNSFQHCIIDNIYQLDLPETDFKILSILLVATPSPAMTNIRFHWEGKNRTFPIPATYTDYISLPKQLGKYLNEELNPEGYHAVFAPRLPRKLLAVRSGLGIYGRNNICYVDGMGSFLNISPFYTDIRCTNDAWYDIRQMDVCKDCKACVKNCPTGAIKEEGTLIDTDRCLTFYNEAGGEYKFPEFIDPVSHNSVVGCMSCQNVCPKNKEYLNSIAGPYDFDEEETALLLKGAASENYPESLKKKVETLGITDYLSALPRNLKALLDIST
jgi:epoxyqueuosine reductase